MGHWYAMFDYNVLYQRLTAVILKGTHITGHFASPNGNRDLDIGLNPAWRDSVMNLIPFEPVEDTASTEVVEQNAKRMTFTKQQALRDIAPQSGAYFNEVSVNPIKNLQTSFQECYQNSNGEHEYAVRYS
jgi:hypothetical protein